MLFGCSRAPVAGAGAPSATPPEASFFGCRSNTRAVTFCCDASVSMIDKLPALKRELAKSIEAMKPNQRFSIIFFVADHTETFEGGAMMAASPENKRRAYAWIEGRAARGTTDPSNGLEFAFAGRPDLMYFLTDGNFADNAAVLERVAALNAEPRVRVNTIAFVLDGDAAIDGEFLTFLQTLADQNGGKFRIVAHDQWSAVQ